MRTIMIAALAATLVACASMKGKGEPLEVRAQQRWDALVAKDWATSYAFLSPGFRSATSEQAYALQMDELTVEWVGAEVLEVVNCELELNTCEVAVNVSYRVTRGLPGVRKPIELQRRVTEDWIESAGTWYFVPDRLR